MSSYWNPIRKGIHGPFMLVVYERLDDDLTGLAQQLKLEIDLKASSDQNVSSRSLAGRPNL